MASTFDSSDYSPRQLVLRADPEIKKVVQCDASISLDLVPDVGKEHLRDLIRCPSFQDCTLLFQNLLNEKMELILCIFPPGSGKTTIANMMKGYLTQKPCCDELEEYLDTCKFQVAEEELATTNPSYKSYRRSSSKIIFLDFNQMRGTSKKALERNFQAMLTPLWRQNVTEDRATGEFELWNSDANSIWLSLMRLCLLMHSYDEKLYVILDSIDHMYNLIAHLPDDHSKLLYRELTKGITNVIDRINNGNGKTIVFGSSPYLIKEFRRYARCHFIGSKDDSVLKYFSYSRELIQRIIEEWKLDVTLEECISVAQFKYDENIFINPYICTSFLKSLKENGSTFTVNISPRSLWLGDIFEEAELKLLRKVLIKEFKSNFITDNREMCIIPDEERSRLLYYQLLLYSGFLSCSYSHENYTKEWYEFIYANDTAKILLQHHLERLFFSKYHYSLKKNNEILVNFLNENYSSFCETLSRAISTLSTFMYADETAFHNYVSGIFYHLEEMGYEAHEDRSIVKIIPYSIYVNNNVAILMEFKSFKIQPKKKKYYTRDELRIEAVEKCKKIAAEAYKIQLNAPAVAAKFHKNVEINLMIFHSNQVVLLHSQYNQSYENYSDYSISSCDSLFTTADLNAILKKAQDSPLCKRIRR